MTQFLNDCSLPYRFAGYTAAALLAVTSDSAWADGPDFSLNASSTPATSPATDPADISLKHDAGSGTFVVADAAAQYKFRIDPTQSTVQGKISAEAHRDTTTGSQVESYALAVGLHFDGIGFLEKKVPPKPKIGDNINNIVNNQNILFPNDISIGFNYQTNFADQTSACKSTPAVVSCLRSHTNSLRAKWTVSPYIRSLTRYRDSASSSDPIKLVKYYAITPTFSLFTDQAIDTKINAASGTKLKGNVTGGTAAIAFSLQPPILGYKITLRGSVQQTELFVRDAPRQAAFPLHSTLESASIDYEFANLSIDKSSHVIPSFGASYAHGDDPLSGKLNRNEWVLGLKIKLV